MRKLEGLLVVLCCISASLGIYALWGVAAQLIALPLFMLFGACVANLFAEPRSR